MLPIEITAEFQNAKNNIKVRGKIGDAILNIHVDRVEWNPKYAPKQPALDSPRFFSFEGRSDEIRVINNGLTLQIGDCSK